MFEEINYTNILKKKFPNNFKRKQKVAFISNIIAPSIKHTIEYFFRSIFIEPNIKIGDYDNIIQEVTSSKNFDIIIIFYDISNLIENNEVDLFIKETDFITKVFERINYDFNYIFDHINQNQNLIINTLSIKHIKSFLIKCKFLENEVINFNHKLLINDKKNVSIIETDDLFIELGLRNAVDFKMFYHFKVLFKSDFFILYLKKTISSIINKNGNAKKVIVFDCDNTLWNGIVSEDGIDNIKFSENDNKGIVFNKVHKIIKFYKKKGILLCLASKNDEITIKNVFEKRNDLLIKYDDFIYKKINWDEKWINIIKISKKLNLGTDSIIFVDDSDFEIDSVNFHLPEVTTLKVPKNIEEYPKTLLSLMSILNLGSETDEDKSRFQLYKDMELRNKLKESKRNINDYLQELKINLEIKINDVSALDRVEQLLQKTNQFNMNKVLFDKKEINTKLKNDNFFIITGIVGDKFGSMGITNLAILEFSKDKQVMIINFIMSCRAFGRKIEYAFFNYIIDFLKEKRIKKVLAIYKKTEKNKKFKDFYRDYNFTKEKNDGLYSSKLNDIKLYQEVDHIKINGI